MIEDETEVQTRHKRQLDKIRARIQERADESRLNDDNLTEDVTEYSQEATRDNATRGHAATREEDLDRDPAYVERDLAGSSGGEEGTSKEPGIVGGPDRRGGSFVATDINTTQVDDSLARTAESERRERLAEPPLLQTDDKIKRELNRQKQERYRDKKRQLEDGVLPGEQPRPRFQLKGLLKSKQHGPTKLFTKKEAEDAHSRLSIVYSQGSHLVDEIIEVVVKDHESVSIWQLAPDESDTLAALHLERAQYDQKAAQSARVLLALYDKMFILMIAWPRVVLTVRHVDKHKGFSLW